MMGWIPRCYIPGFVEIGLSVLEKISKGFLSYMGMAAILVMWPASCHQIFISLYRPESFQTKFGSDQHSSFSENPVQILYVHNFGPRSRNSLDLQYSHIFIYSIKCLFLLTFRSLAAIVSDKSTVFIFSNRKA